MAGIASGVGKLLVIGKETVWGTPALTSAGKYYRRVTCDLNLTREQFQSAQIVSTAQTVDSRSGTDNVEGTLSDELAPGSHTDLWAGLLRGTWANGATSGALTNVTAASAGKTFTRAAGSWLTDGFRVGDMVDATGFAAPATANNKRYVITALTATVMTVGETVTSKAAGDSVTFLVAGKKLAIPLDAASRTDDSFTVEQFFSDVGVSRRATGVKIGSASVSVDPDAIATVEFGMMGKDMLSTSSAYFVTPTAASTTGVLTGNAGALYSGGVQLAVVTAFSIEITGNHQVEKTIGNLQPDGTRPAAGISLGRITASGEFSAFFLDDSLFAKFRDETPVALTFRFNGEGNQAFAITLPKIKLGGATLDDKEVGALVQSVPFVALLPDGTDVSINQSTVVLQEVVS
jgi:hypothetical protein